MKQVLFVCLLYTIIIPGTVSSQNVGIGVTNPAAKLEIRGSTGTLDNSLLVRDGSGNTLLSVNNQGRTGINTVNPEVPLHVYSALDEVVRIRGGFPYISFYKSDVYAGYLWANGLYFELGTPSGSDIPIMIAPGLNATATFMPDGNVGIGATDPAFRLDINGRVRLRHQGQTAGIWFNNTTNTGLVGFEGVFSNNAMGWYGNVSGWSMLMNTNTGNIGIGTTTDAINAKLEVRGTGSSSTVLKLANGAIRYEGAGVNTATAVFVHKATATNSFFDGSFSAIDNPYCNNNPSAILIATLNATYGVGTGSGYTEFPPNDPGCMEQICRPVSFYVFYNGPASSYYATTPVASRDKWCIRSFIGTFVGDIRDFNFNIMVVQP